MRKNNITDTHPIEYWILLKDKTEIFTSMKYAKASTPKPNRKPLPGYKTLGIDPAICFYEIEDVNKTEEGEEE